MISSLAHVCSSLASANREFNRRAAAAAAARAAAAMLCRRASSLAGRFIGQLKAACGGAECLLACDAVCSLICLFTSFALSSSLARVWPHSRAAHRAPLGCPPFRPRRHSGTRVAGPLKLFKPPLSNESRARRERAPRASCLRVCLSACLPVSLSGRDRPRAPGG